MIFAADLDQTLIYSKRTMIIEPKDVVLIEKDGDKAISFTTKQVIFLLRQIAKRVTFIPVTTRSLAQYKRINLFQQDIVPQYAVIRNGGTILINGQFDQVWEKKVRKKLKACAGLNEVVPMLNGISFKIVDDLFIAGRLLGDISQKLQLLKNRLNHLHWYISFQQNRFYIMPKALCKGNALSYLKDVTNTKTVIAAGDSTLDLMMLKLADYTLIPNHSVLGNYNWIDYQTKTAGMVAASEILKTVSRRVRT